MKNKLTDLNNHLFAQLERLGDEDLSEEEMKKEIERSKAITNISNSIINNAKVILDASKFLEDSGMGGLAATPQTIKMLGVGVEEDEQDKKIHR